MNTQPIVQINLTIDPTVMTADEAGAYAACVVAKVAAELASGAGAATGSPAHIVGIDKQLARLTDYATTFAPHIKAAHAQLITAGYVPQLPNSKKDPLPPYISYIDPVTGQNLGNLNSERFVFMRGPLRAKLKDLLGFDSDSRYASRRVNGADGVAAVIKVAVVEKVATKS